MRHCLFVAFESPALLGFVPPVDTKWLMVQSPDQFLAAFVKAQQEQLSLVFIASESDTFRLSQLTEARSIKGGCPSYGWIVISENLKDFLNSPHIPRNLIDVVSAQQFRNQTESIFLKATEVIRFFNSPRQNRISAATLTKLNKIFLSLTVEREPQKLLFTILSKAMELLSAQGGSLFVVNEKDDELSFKYRVQDKGNNEVILDEINHPVLENSVCGYVVLTGKSSNIQNVVHNRTNLPPLFNKLVDHQQIPQTFSLISIPLVDSRGDCRAVLQLSNKSGENGHITHFDEDDESVLRSFGTQAAICLESADVYTEVKKLFEGFVKAAITAIESRDPSTGGHSERVASMCVALARATTEVSTGIYRSVKFKEEEIKELEYAALLHDFGKIGIREEVLVKSKKLYSHQLEAIRERMRTCRAAAQIFYLEERLKQGDSKRDRLEREFQEKVQKMESFWNVILSANEPNILHKESEKLLDAIREERFFLPDGSEITLLNEEEYLALSVTRGSLTELERLEIESHVRHTYQFLKMIPWTRDFRGLTEIAYCHHEKLDGSGYPRGLTSHEIPLQSKIMTISDIFDALTAADRWYKEAVPIEKALEILAQEVKEGKLDPVLFEIFKDKKIYTAAVVGGLSKVA